MSIFSIFREYRRRKRSADLYERKHLHKPGDYYARHCFDYYKCIFIHVPKTAGVSVSRSLFGHNTDHAGIDWYFANYPKHTVKQYFKFAFVRNPWDRLYSAFHFLKKGGMFPVDAAFYEEHLSHLPDFEAFVMEWLTEERLDAISHFVPQYRFITSTDEPDEVLMDFTGRFENLQNDFAFVCSKLGLKGRVLQQHNVSAGAARQYTGAYSKEMKDKVQSLYARDVALFQYHFE